MYKGEAYATHIRRDRNYAAFPEALAALSSEVQSEVFYRVAFKGYLDRELKQVEKLRHIDKIKIPSDINYRHIVGLRAESAEKLFGNSALELGAGQSHQRS